MKKQLLTVEYDFNFLLIGLCCVSKDYRVCYEINNKLGLILKKVDDIVLGTTAKRRGKEPDLLPDEDGDDWDWEHCGWWCDVIIGTPGDGIWYDSRASLF